MKHFLLSLILLQSLTSASHLFKSKTAPNSEQSLIQSFELAGKTSTGMRYFIVPKPYIDVRYLAESDDKLMNKLILDGHAVVLESDPMLSQDDSYCGCNCKCCFNL